MTSPRYATGSGSRRSLGILVTAFAIAATTQLWGLVRGLLPGDDEPRAVVVLPGGPTSIEAPNDERRPLGERIAFWTARVGDQPADAGSWRQLAIAVAEQGRLYSDLNAFERAAEAAERAIAIAPAAPASLAVRASIRFSLHDFRGAVADAEAALAVDGADASALAVLGDAELELGHLDAAAGAYERLAAVAGGPAIDIRLARLAHVSGDPSGAMERARRALIVASGGGPAGMAATSPVELAFYHFALGEQARVAGDAALAGEQFAAALELRPDDIGALLGTARVLAFRGDLDGAIDALRRAEAIAPLPDVEALLGDLLSLRGGPGDSTAASIAYATVRFTASLSESAGGVYDRALIIFELDHAAASQDPEDLVGRARSALEKRADAVGHDLLAWALYRAGDPAGAWTSSLVARSSGIVDARILYHAGAIALARGAADEARSSLEAALALGPALDPLERLDATRLLALVP